MSRERSGRASQGKARTRITSVKGNYFKVQRGELSKIQESGSQWTQISLNNIIAKMPVYYQQKVFQKLCQKW